MSILIIVTYNKDVKPAICLLFFVCERFIITRRDKPVAAIVSLDDLKILEQYQERQGLAAVASSWPDFEEVAVAVIDLRELRRQGGGGRDVSL
jgi:antitoxin (DNA-binding transcriptional repressor) of toxin-antitoxin stability system